MWRGLCKVLATLRRGRRMDLPQPSRAWACAYARLHAASDGRTGALARGSDALQRDETIARLFYGGTRRPAPRNCASTALECAHFNQRQPRDRRHFRATRARCQRRKTRTAHPHQRRARLFRILATHSDDSQSAANTRRLVSNHAAAPPAAHRRGVGRQLGTIRPSSLPKPLAATQSINLPNSLNQRCRRQ